MGWKTWVPALCSLAACVLAEKQPNIMVVLTDDQDYEMQSLDYMPLLHQYILNEGTLFDRHYCTVAICCPSRVSCDLFSIPLLDTCLTDPR